MEAETVIVNFSYDHLRDGHRIRSRGTLIKLTINRYDKQFFVNAIGEDFQGRGQTLKEAVLDYLSQSNLL